MTGHEPDELEARLRRALRSDAGIAPESSAFAARVHRGAGRRRRRQVVASTAAVALVVAGGFATAQLALPDGDGSAPVAGPTAGTATSPGPGGPASPGPGRSPAPADLTVLALAASDPADPWTLAVTPGGDCTARPGQGCAVVVGAGADDGSSDVGVPAPADPASADRSTRYEVSQLAVAGSAADGYDAWAFGGGFVSRHGTAGPWRSVSVPTTGAVTEVAADGDTVYAVFQDTTASLWSSPVSTDAFTPLSVGGTTLGVVSHLVASDGVIAFLNTAGGRASVVQSSTRGASWASGNPCGQGQPSALSAAEGSLWALCADGGRATVWTTPGAAGAWRRVGATVASDSLLAARSATTAVVGGQEGLRVVGPHGSRPLSSADLGDASLLFADPETGYAVVDGRAFRSDDGGRSWARQQPTDG